VNTTWSDVLTDPSRSPDALATSRIAIVLIGPDCHAGVEALGPDVAETFDAELVVAPSEIIVPHDAWNSTRRQYRAAAIVSELAAQRRPEWDRVLGIADVDLYAFGTHFVFGHADPSRGVAVVSLARFRQAADGELIRRRVTTEAIRELGRSYGLQDCHDRACAMWFANTVHDIDRKSPSLCPDHERLLRIARSEH
jgi:predicted Zn-dependent protease